MGNSQSNDYGNLKEEYGERLMEYHQHEDGKDPTELADQSSYVPKDKSSDPYETLDYDRIENQLYLGRFVGINKEGMEYLKAFAHRYHLWRWFMNFAIGFCTAICAFYIDYLVNKISTSKFDHINHYVEECDSKTKGCLGTAWILLILFNVGFVFIATFLCTNFAPCASGSGIPEIKCFLNGIKRADWLTFKTLFVKVNGVLFSVSATMPVGKEGPMIHSGAIVGAGLPQGRSTRLGWDFSKTMFRNDRAKRDFVAAGAAAGVSAAFGAPIGGVLFSLEEGASHWNQSLTWRTLFCSMSSLFVLHFFLSGTLDRDNPGGGWGKLSSGGLIDFGNFNLLAAQDESDLWTVVDLFIFIVMGVIGGLFGGLWNNMQTWITKKRMIHSTTKIRQMSEICAIAFFITSIMFLAAMYWGRCFKVAEQSQLDSDEVRQYFCDDDEYNDMATLAFNPLEAAIHQLFHLEADFSLVSCFLFFLLMFFNGCITYGTMIPSGLFVPALVTGAAYGRFIGEFFKRYTDHTTYRGTYALIGAAAFLGGVVRMTISLTVILMEATNEVSFGLPIMVTLLVAKWVGDYFNVGIYDIHIHLRKVPLLEWEAEEEMKRYLAKDVMSSPVTTLTGVVRVSDLVRTLKSCTFNGFPVVESVGEHPDTFRGLILRSQLITMLQERCWGQMVGDSTDQRLLHHKDFVRKYPQRTPIEHVTLPDGLDNVYMDVRPYMSPSILTIKPDCPLPRVFLIYRSLGLRHIPVLDDHSQVKGIITRKELTPFKIHDLDHAFEHNHDPSLTGV
eukprot:m.24465 g.24465  ORF g.24465 m.24465 type:complete len:784 (+) comp13387_c0_seq1:82-2433(+)